MLGVKGTLLVVRVHPPTLRPVACWAVDLSKGVPGGSPTHMLGVKGTLLVVRVHPPSLRPVPFWEVELEL